MPHPCDHRHLRFPEPIEDNKKGTPGRAFAMVMHHSLSSPSKGTELRGDARGRPLRPRCPTRHRMVFRRHRPHLKGPNGMCACSGREKGACDGLQRHPLIDPIFGSRPGGSRGRSLSASLAGRNLHLVISVPAEIQPLVLRYSIVRSAGFYTRHGLPSRTCSCNADCHERTNSI